MARLQIVCNFSSISKDKFARRALIKGSGILTFIPAIFHIPIFVPTQIFTLASAQAVILGQLDIYTDINL